MQDNNKQQKPTIEAVVLAGGMARRMGGDDKGLVTLNGKAMICHTLDRLAPQVNSIVINANRNQADYEQFGFKVISDDTSGYLGPLAGMVTALCRTQADYLLTVPCDSPLLPVNLASKMLAMLIETQADIIVAGDGKREQPVVMLLSPSLASSMQAFLDNGERKIDFWYQQHNYQVCHFGEHPDAFINVNTPEQKQQLEAQIKV